MRAGVSEQRAICHLLVGDLHLSLLIVGALLQEEQISVRQLPTQSFDPPLTRVDLAYEAEERHYRLIFGKPNRILEEENTFGRARRSAWFEEGSIFGLDLWEGALIKNRAGDTRTRTRARSCFVLQAGGVGDELTRVPQVSPGAHLLIGAHGVRRSKFLLQWLAELTLRCNPCALDAEFYSLKSLPISVLVPEREPVSAIGFPTRAASP